MRITVLTSIILRDSVIYGFLIMTNYHSYSRCVRIKDYLCRYGRKSYYNQTAKRKQQYLVWSENRHLIHIDRSFRML